MLPPASTLRDDLAADERRGAEPDDRDDEIEVADEAGGVEHRRPRRARVGHGVEAHQDVRQAEQARASARGRARPRRADR